MRNFRKKIFPVLRKTNSAKLIAFHEQKWRKSSQQKKICAKIAQILRKRFSHFVETLVSEMVFRNFNSNSEKINF